MKKVIALLCAVLILGVSVKAVEVEAPSALLMEKEKITGKELDEIFKQKQVPQPAADPATV